MVSTDVIRSDMGRVRTLCADLVALSWTIQESYEALYESAYSQIQVPTGAEENGLAPGKKRWRPTDPTGDVATSGLHRRLRWHTHRVASKLRELTPIMEDAEGRFVQAADELAPEMREKLERLREIEEAVAQSERTG